MCQDWKCSDLYWFLYNNERTSDFFFPSYLLLGFNPAIILPGTIHLTGYGKILFPGPGNQDLPWVPRKVASGLSCKIAGTRTQKGKVWVWAGTAAKPERHPRVILSLHPDSIPPPPLPLVWPQATYFAVQEAGCQAGGCSCLFPAYLNAFKARRAKRHCEPLQGTWGLSQEFPGEAEPAAACQQMNAKLTAFYVTDHASGTLGTSALSRYYQLFRKVKRKKNPRNTLMSQCSPSKSAGWIYCHMWSPEELRWVGLHPAVTR